MIEAFIGFCLILAIIGGVTDGICKILGISLEDTVHSSKNLFTFLFTDKY